MSKKGILRTKDEGQIVDYYPQTTYDSVIDEKGGTLDKDITSLKSFQSTATSKLDGIANNATKTEKSSTNGNVLINGSETVVYTHPATSGNKHIPAGGSSGQILRWAADGTATWGADNNTTYSVATTSANGLMSSTDKSKLDGIATGANNYSHPTGDGNSHIPANGTSNSGKYLQATGTAGTYQWATLPSASTSTAGIVQLSSATNSTSTSLAATASAVKAAYDLAAGKANASHGNHVPSTQTANNAVFLRNDNTWQTVTPDNIGAIPQPTDLTGKTVDIDTYNLSSGTPKKQYYIETTTGGATNISNIPVKEPFTLEVESIRWASTSDYITKQTFVSATTKSTYERWCTNGTWTTWLNAVKMDATPVSGQVLIANGTTGGIKTSGYTIAKSVPSNAVFTDTTYSVATTGANGLMSSTDKTKLDGIATGANNYSHPTTSGNKHIPAGGSSGQILRWSADGTAAWGADNNTTYSVATTSANGLMSSTDKTKLDGIATGATKTVLNNTVTSTSTTEAATANAVKTAYDLAASKANASHGNHVPTTQSANNTIFLRNDNTWQTVNPDNIGASRGAQVSGSTAATANWYRIAQSGADIGNNIGEFHIRAAASGLHTSTIIAAGITYGQNPNLQQIAHTRYSGDGITKVRMVYHTTYSGNRAYLEIYVPTAVARTVNVQLFGSLGWTLVAPSTVGSIPSGYTSKEITLVAGRMVTDINGTVNGYSIAASVPSGAKFTDTTYSAATTSANGLMSSTDKSKLDGIATGATKTVLNNTVTSTSTTEAATANAVKTAYDKANHSHPYAATSHGNHVPTTQTASNSVFLRNDNTWATVTPANIGAAAASHGNHVPTKQTANARIFLRNDNTWQSLPTASTSATGIVQLSSSVSSTSTTVAANCYAVKQAYDKAVAAASAAGGTTTTTVAFANGWYSVDMSSFQMSSSFSAHKSGSAVTLAFTTLMNDSSSFGDLAYLPSGYRPSTKLLFADGFGNKINVLADGTIQINSVNNMGWAEPITYVATS